MEEVYFDKEGREKLLSGINKLNKVVASTMGPMGKTVIIPSKSRYGEYDATKDGVSVAESISFRDPVENIGASFVRKAAQKTVSQAGDGTTTATVLATAFINKLKDFNSVEVNRAFDTIIPEVIKQLKLDSRELKREDIKHVASISANNDLQIGDTIQQAYNYSDIVKVEESNELEDKLILSEGMTLEVPYFSKHFVTDEKKGTCEYMNPSFLLIDGKLERLEPFKAAIESAQSPETPLVIMTEHIHDSALRKLESFVLSKALYLVVIKTPGFGPFRKDLISDLAVFTGATPISDMNQQYSTAILGKLASVKAGLNTTILIKDSSIDVGQRVMSLRSIASTDITDHQKQLLEKRIHNLQSEVAIIKVGGRTEHEMIERYDRYDDAVRAVACALEEGVVEGGGVALFSAGFDLLSKFESPVYDAILESIDAPMNTIKDSGVDFKDADMFRRNIIDPLKVTRCALENAVVVAKTVLGTEAVVLSKLEWNN